LRILQCHYDELVASPFVLSHHAFAWSLFVFMVFGLLKLHDSFVSTLLYITVSFLTLSLMYCECLMMNHKKDDKELIRQYLMSAYSKNKISKSKYCAKVCKSIRPWRVDMTGGFSEIDSLYLLQFIDSAFTNIIALLNF